MIWFVWSCCVWFVLPNSVDDVFGLFGYWGFVVVRMRGLTIQEV